MDTGEIRPFANGVEYRAWTGANCARCPFSYDELAGRFDCAVEEALGLASLGDGTISAEIAERMGWKPESITRLGWPCKEKAVRTEREKQARLPEDQKMSALGAPRLF